MLLLKNTTLFFFGLLTIFRVKIQVILSYYEIEYNLEMTNFKCFEKNVKI